ncbi:MAG: hypothetical protein ACLUEU_01650 [Oscillospiraceae bacterium]
MRILILTATSGDTGKAAAMEGFCDVAWDEADHRLLLPDGGVSAVQKAQMVTPQGGDNAPVSPQCGAATSTTRRLPSSRSLPRLGGEDLLAGKGVRLSQSANSINIGRLAPRRLGRLLLPRLRRSLVRRGTVAVGERAGLRSFLHRQLSATFFAGYFARELGLPVGTLRVRVQRQRTCSPTSSATGRYDKKRPFYPHQVALDGHHRASSNLERLLLLLSGDGAAGWRKLMRQLTEDGAYEVLRRSWKEKIPVLFWAGGCCGDAETKRTIGRARAE